VVLEVLKAEGKGAEAQVARAYGVHPVTLAKWKRHFLEHRAEVFGSKEEVKAYEKKIAELERKLGQKEVKTALFKNFLGGWERYSTASRLGVVPPNSRKAVLV